jgi:peptidoglycan/xylan/chitin deacetylase (PgdA/CDA1 family)
MADHPDTWARIIEMARARFPGDESTAHAFARETYDAEETTAYAAAQDAEDEQQAILEAARGAEQLYTELDSAATGWSARVVAREANMEALHVSNDEVPDDVDDDVDDFADFNKRRGCAGPRRRAASPDGLIQDCPP